MGRTVPTLRSLKVQKNAIKSNHKDKTNLNQPKYLKDVQTETSRK